MKAKKRPGITPTSLYHLINLPLDVPDTPVDRSFRHIERVLYLHNGVRLDTQVKHGPLLIREIALPAKSFTFGFGEFGLDVQRVTPSF